MFIYYFVVRTQKSTIFQFAANSRAFLGIVYDEIAIISKMSHYVLYRNTPLFYLHGHVFMCHIRIFVDCVFSCLDCFNGRGLLTQYS